MSEEALRVSCLQVVDEEGRVRIELGVSENAPSIRLLDPAGRVRARVVADDGITRIEVCNPYGETRITLNASDKMAAIGVQAANATPVSIACKPFEESAIMFQSGDGSSRHLLGVDASGHFFSGVSEENGG